MRDLTAWCRSVTRSDLFWKSVIWGAALALRGQVNGVQCSSINVSICVSYRWQGVVSSPPFRSLCFHHFQSSRTRKPITLKCVVVQILCPAVGMRSDATERRILSLVQRCGFEGGTILPIHLPGRDLTPTLNALDLAFGEQAGHF